MDGELLEGVLSSEDSAAMAVEAAPDPAVTSRKAGARSGVTGTGLLDIALLRSRNRLGGGSSNPLKDRQLYGQGPDGLVQLCPPAQTS